MEVVELRQPCNVANLHAQPSCAASASVDPRKGHGMGVITEFFPWLTNGPLILVQVLSGLGVGMFLFLVSSGMSLIFGVTRIVNLAHGSFYMIAAYLMYTLMSILPETAAQFWIALLLAPLGWQPWAGSSKSHCCGRSTKVNTSSSYCSPSG